MDLVTRDRVVLPAFLVNSGGRQGLAEHKPKPAYRQSTRNNSTTHRNPMFESPHHQQWLEIVEI